MAKIINDWKKTAPDTLKIDWTAVEKDLSFALHDNFKDFYSRVTAKKCKGIMKFNPADFVKEYVNKENWLENSNGGFPNCEFELYPITKTDTEYLCAFFRDAFSGDWTGGNDFGHRAYIGEINLNIGQICLIVNNDTGKFEWVDMGYGYFDVYEENPYGIIADSAEEFLGKISQ